MDLEKQRDNEARAERERINKFRADQGLMESILRKEEIQEKQRRLSQDKRARLAHQEQ